jgi:hypothetical protein
MRKFLKVIEESKPGNNSQYVISIKGPAELEDINVSGDEYTFDLYQKIKAVVEGRADVVVHEEDTEYVEDNEMQKAAKAIGTVMSIPDQGVKSLIPGTTASKAQKLKRKFLNKLTKDLKDSNAI